MPRHSGDATLDVVVKVGGGLLADAEHFDAAVGIIAAAAVRRRLLVVPGGGPFADAVRHAAPRLKLSDSAAHWMAILAMDQYAHVLADRIAGGALVEDPEDVRHAIQGGCVPVLMPFRWLRRADPLPHGWHVTSDSIAAWVAGELHAPRLLLVKPPHAGGASMVDEYFVRALPATVQASIVPADQRDLLRAALDA